MAITTLVGTKWLMKDADVLQLPQDELVQGGAALNFTSNGESFTNFYVGSEQNGWIKYNNKTALYTVVGDVQTWNAQAYRAIYITGGDDATSASGNFSYILDWLQDNAALITPDLVLKDVTGTETTYNGVENVKIANTEGNDITFRDTIDGCGQRNKILSGTFAYGYGGKIEGNIPIQAGYTVTRNGTLSTSGKYFSGNIEVDVPTGVGNPLFNATNPLYIKVVQNV